MRLTPHRQVANPRGEQSPEGDASALSRTGFARGSTGGRQRHEGHRIREGAKASRGGKALKGKPTSGTGTKQGRKVLEEVNRQEGVKP